ncbi:MAG: molybdenum cofactor guanylyltransferase [Candidatus Lokiarchaeota archaeon]|nr:molybdenum cofactor guanylyltransferase [Candidatus Lokiarchaeota archaeon]
MYNGKPLITHQIENLSNLNYPIFIVANNIEQVQTYIQSIDISKITAFFIDDHDIIESKNIRSPLIGLYTALKELQHLNYQNAFILSCDNPFFNIEVIKFMMKQFASNDACMPIWDNNYVEPLFAIYKIAPFLKKSKENLNNNCLKLSKLLDPTKMRIKYVSIENEIKFFDGKLGSFININDPTDLSNLNHFKEILFKSLK